MDALPEASGLLPALLAPELAPLFWRPSRLGYDSAWTAHVPFAHWIVGAIRPRLLVELGTHHGVSYAGFCEAVVQNQLATRCYAVDTWEGDEHAGHYDESVYHDLKRFHDQRYAAFSEMLRCTFDAALDYMQDGSIDLLHIDGCHGYSEVRHDFEAWLPKLSDRAVVLFHDTNVRERDFGVWRLFAELGERYPAFEFLHEYGLGVVAVGPHAAEAVRALCALRDPAQIVTVRERFSQLGERWRAEVHIRLLNEQTEAAKAQLRSESRMLQDRALEAQRIGARAAQRAADARRAAAAAYADVDRLTAELHAVRVELGEQNRQFYEAHAEQHRASAEVLGDVLSKLAAAQEKAAELQTGLDAAQQEMQRSAAELRTIRADAERGRAAMQEAARLRQQLPDYAAEANHARHAVELMRHEAQTALLERDAWARLQHETTLNFVDAGTAHDRVAHDRDVLAAELVMLRAENAQLGVRLSALRRNGPQQPRQVGSLRRLRRAVGFGVRLAWWTASLRLRKALRVRAALNRDLAMLAATHLFDAAWYMETHPDVDRSGVDPALHFLRFGGKERRNPGPLFDSGAYLDDNPDIAAAGLNPLLHFLRYGAVEGRRAVPVGRPLVTVPPALPPRAAPPPPELRQADLNLADWTAAAAPAAALAPLPSGPAALRIVYFEGEPGTPGARYRVERPAEAARRNGAAVEIYPIAEAMQRRESILAADIVVIWRAAWSAEVVTVIEAARHSGAKLVFDVDDLMVEPELATVDLIDGIRTQFIPVEAVRGHYTRVRDTMANCDFCIASTDELAWYMRRHAKTTFVLPNGFDAEVLRVSRQAVRQRRAAPNDGLLRIGYAAGSRTHQKDFALAASAVARILRQHSHVRLVLFSSPVDSLPVLDIAEYGDFAGLTGQIEWRMMVPLEQLPSELARFDINLAPVETGNPFCEAKSELKYFEAALAGAVTIASPTGPYRRAIAHGRTGMLADTPQAWYRALDSLVSDPSLARRIAQAAYRDVLWQFGPERRVELLAAMLDQLQGGPAAARAFALDLHRNAIPRRDPPIAETETIFLSDTLADAEVTVIVPLYNYEHHVVEALDSVLGQTLAALHLVIVDDASTDDSLHVAVEWAKYHAARFGRIAVLRNIANAGLGPTRNAGFNAAETRFVLPLDADNRLRPDCCATLLAEAERSGAAFVYPLIREFGDAGGLMGSLPYAPARLIGVPYIDAMALVSVAAWAAVGGYFEGRLGWEDYEFWCRMAEYGLSGLQVAPEPLADYRVHRRSMLQSVTEAKDNKPLVMAEMKRRHPWLSFIYAPPHSAPLPVPADAVGTLEALLPLLRCPLTGQALRLDAAAGYLVTEDGAQRWPVVDGRPVLFDGLQTPQILPAPTDAAPLPPSAEAVIREAGGPVLLLSPSGTGARLANVIELSAALYPNTQVIADAQALPFADASLAAAVVLRGFEQYRDPHTVVAELLRVLRPGGRVLVQTVFLPQQDAESETRQAVEAWFDGFDTEALHVPGDLGAAHTVAWLAHTAQTALARDRSPDAARSFAATPVGQFAALWTDPAARAANPRWRDLQDLPQAAQEAIAAGFEYIGRRPLS